MLNISKQIYVGWDLSAVFSYLPEAEIIPIGNSSQEKKKMEKFVIKHSSLNDTYLVAGSSREIFRRS